MFKLVVLSCLVSVALAGVISHPVEYAQVKTIVEPHVSVVETPTISHVGSVVKSFPSATSYQSQTQYHSKSIVEPIYAHGVEKKYISTPVVKEVVEHVPVAKTIVSQPIIKAVHAEPIYAKAAYVAEPYAHYAAPAHYAKAAYVSAPAISYAHHAPAAHYAHAPVAAYSAYPYADYAHHY